MLTTVTPASTSPTLARPFPGGQPQAPAIVCPDVSSTCTTLNNLTVSEDRGFALPGFDWSTPLLSATCADDLVPVAQFLKTEAGPLETLQTARYPETIYLLRNPDEAGVADDFGTRARSLSAFVNALDDVSAGREAFEQGDPARFALVFDILLAQRAVDAVAVPEPVAPVATVEPTESHEAPVIAPFANAPRRLLAPPPGAALPKLLDVSRLLASTSPEDAHALAGSMQRYLQEFRGFGPGFESLMHTLPPATFLELLASLRVYGEIAPGLQQRLLLERDLTNIGTIRDYSASNLAITGCDGSFFMKPDARAAGCLEPGRPTCSEMHTAMSRPDGSIVYPRIFNAAAPALDSTRQPEYELYVKNGCLDPALYRRQIAAIFGQFRQAVDGQRPGRVVLSAIGTQSFLMLLNSEDKDVARKIVASALADTIVELRGKGIPTVFTDRDAKGVVWALVNHQLQLGGHAPIDWVGAVPGNWAGDGDLLLNGADSASVTGNHCARDRSIDGFLGANSLVHVVHLLLCGMHGRGRIATEPADAGGASVALPASAGLPS